jgi:hypothetical protein
MAKCYCKRGSLWAGLLNKSSCLARPQITTVAVLNFVHTEANVNQTRMQPQNSVTPNLKNQNAMAWARLEN